MISALRLDHQRLNRGRTGKLRRIAASLSNRGFHVLMVYRLSHRLWQVGVPALPALLSRIVQIVYAVDIDYQAQIGAGCVIFHCFGLVVGNATVIEGNCILYHGVTLGNRGSEWVGDMIQDGQPIVESNCIFGAGAKVLGPVRIGRNSVIGSNAVVTRDVLPNSVMAGVPAKRISERALMDEQMRAVNGCRRSSR